MHKSLILCNCLGTQDLNSDGLEAATGLRCSKVHSALCTGELEQAQAAIQGGDAIICCAQEQALFEQLAVQNEVDEPPCLDLRDRAGWSDDPGSKLPKMAALVADAGLNLPPEKSIDIQSAGTCLIIGHDEIALDAAEQLSEHLSVTVLLSAETEAPASRKFDVLQGHVRNAQGSLGNFTVRFDGARLLQPGGRGALRFEDPRDGARSTCDIILDLSGGTPLFPAPEKRDGYLRADPGSLKEVSKQILAASHLTGTFEKTLYVRLDSMICAHSRAGQTACSNCLDLCPTGAITSQGDHVAVDPQICAGCGACSSACPSGAISYDAPSPDTLFQRIQTLAWAYRDAGGVAPRLLVVDDFGSEMIQLAARFARGLPADVIPLDVGALNTFGHAEMLVAQAAGFADVALLLSQRTDHDALKTQVDLARALGAQVTVLDLMDPAQLSDQLYAATPAAPITTPVRPLGTRRQVTRVAAKALNPESATLPLPEAAPYGAVLVNTDACTLCLSCVSLCPVGALGDNPDLPQLRFQEDACLQCGLCANVCPEDAISYEPRLNLTHTALEQVVLHEEEPFACVECGTPFGVRSTIERIMDQLAGKHEMFKSGLAARMIQMCDDCRVNAQFKASDNPFQGRPRPKPRTTGDYLEERDET